MRPREDGEPGVIFETDAEKLLCYQAVQLSSKAQPLPLTRAGEELVLDYDQWRDLRRCLYGLQRAVMSRSRRERLGVTVHYAAPYRDLRRQAETLVEQSIRQLDAAGLADIEDYLSRGDS